MGMKRANARRELAAMRDRIGKMNSQQLKSFFAGFDIDTLDRIDSTLAKARDQKKDKERSKLQKQIAKLNRKLEQL